MDISTLKFDENGLIPGIVQDLYGEVRMMAWLNHEALELTLKNGYATFWSRSRKALWTKGETSGNRLKVVQIRPDCDQDTLLILAEPEGPSCHNGTTSCFDSEEPWPTTLPWLGRLETLLKDRKAHADAEGSYTQKLFAKGVDRIGKKVVEEAGEVVIAAKNDDREEFLGEAADLIFHLDLLLLNYGASLNEAIEVLHKRHAKATGGPA